MLKVITNCFTDRIKQNVTVSFFILSIFYSYFNHFNNHLPSISLHPQFGCVDEFPDNSEKFECLDNPIIFFFNHHMMNERTMFSSISRVILSDGISVIVRSLKHSISFVFSLLEFNNGKYYYRRSS